MKNVIRAKEVVSIVLGWRRAGVMEIKTGEDV